MSKNYFTELNAVDVSGKVEKKNGLSYLSWSFAWGELKKRYPLSSYKVHEDDNGRFWFDDGRTGWVKTSVTVVFDDGTGISHTECLPIMDVRNRSIPAEQITSFDANKSVQRSLTKAVARHGLGLYVYAGEDLPEEVKNAQAEERKKENERINDAQIKMLSDKCNELNVPLSTVLNAYKVTSIENMTNGLLVKAMKRLEATPKKEAK